MNTNFGDDIMNELERARDFFKKDCYATETTGIVIEALGKDYAKRSLKLGSKHLNAVGHPMGGVMYTLADFVFAVSTNFDADCVTVTVVSQICYLNPVRGDILYGESRLIKDGKTNCFYEISITDNLGTRIATVTTTGQHLR